MHLLVSQMPRRKSDAKALAAHGDAIGSGAEKRVQGVEMVNVVEVLSDHYEGRVGAWGTFRVDSEGVLKAL